MARAKVRVLAQTICIHGDTPGAPQVAAAVARKVEGSGRSTTASFAGLIGMCYLS